MPNKISGLLFGVAISIFIGCSKHSYIDRIEGQLIAITDSLASDQAIEAYIRPYRERVERDLDSVLSYSFATYDKNDGELNTAIGNLMTTIIFEQANPIFKSRSGNDIDAILINHGGIRAVLSKGNVTKRTAYEIMPFENAIVVLAIKGKYVKDMVDYLVKAKRAHPIMGLKIQLNSEYELISATINGSEIIDDKTYYIATNDYLYGGGDGMEFFRKSDKVFELDYKIRNAMIDYFSKNDTLRPVRDDRFTIKKEL